MGDGTALAFGNRPARRPMVVRWWTCGGDADLVTPWAVEGIVMRMMALVAVMLAGCATAPEPVGLAEAEALSGAALEGRLTNTQLTLFATDGAEGVLTMTLRGDNLGTAALDGTDMPGFEQVFRWTVEGRDLCTEYLAAGGVATGQIDCVTPAIAGDRITIRRARSTGGTEVFVGRISRF